MAEPIQTDKDKRVDAWEAKWAEQDFSWDGLKAHKWLAPLDFPGPGETVLGGDTPCRLSNLQEYWRWSVGVLSFENENRLLTDEELAAAGLLQTVDDTLWHVAHLKDAHAHTHKPLSGAILARLKAAIATDEDPWFEQTPDTRCQFAGARAKGIDRLFQQFTSAQDTYEGAEAVVHLNATFSEFTSGSFRSLVFGDFTRFAHAQFTGDTEFDDARFTGETGFYQAQFNGNASFISAQFADIANFTETKFISSASFKYALFARNTLFQGAHFLADATFLDAQYAVDAVFTDAAFSGDTRFDHAQFKRAAHFKRVTFKGEARFEDVIFTGMATFKSAQFYKAASFKDAQWGWASNKKAYLPVHYGRAFYTARFHESANFETDRFTAFAAFDGAEFERKLYLRLPNKSSDPKDHFDRASHAVRSQIAKDEETARNNETEERPPDLVSTSAQTKYWGELAAGYKTAKAAMLAEGDFDRAQLYNRFEIQARMKQPRATRLEKTAAALYGLSSNYGGSLIRPPAALFVVGLIFTGLYLILAHVNGAVDVTHINTNAALAPETYDAISLSFKNAFLNLDSFGGSALTVAQTSEKLFGNGWVAGIARALGVLQTLISLILAFLFGLALKRKFQIG